MPHKTQLESHLERVKYEIAQEFGLTQRENEIREKQNEKDFSNKKFNINKSKKLKIE